MRIVAVKIVWHGFSIRLAYQGFPRVISMIEIAGMEEMTRESLKDASTGIGEDALYGHAATSKSPANVETSLGERIPRMRLLNDQTLQRPDWRFMTLSNECRDFTHILLDLIHIVTGIPLVLPRLVSHSTPSSTISARLSEL